MKNSKMSKDKKQKDLLNERKKAVEFAMSMRGQMLIGKALHYGMIKIMEVEKEKPHFQSWKKELEELKSQTPIPSKDMKRIGELQDLTHNYTISDVDDLEYIARHLYSPWIELAKMTDEFGDGNLDKLLKSEK